MGKRWLPIESNPEVLNRFASILGLDVSKVSFHDVFGLDPELLAMVPQPAHALMLLFPITDETEKAKQDEEERLLQQDQPGAKDVYFMKQTIGNACGTIALLHAIGNKRGAVTLDSGSFFDRFFADTAELSPEARGAYLENPTPGAPDIDTAHKEAAERGVSAVPSVDEKVNLHFVALVERGGKLWELDGRKKFPISHGASSPETFLTDAAKVCKEFMEAVPNALQFNIMAFCDGAAEAWSSMSTNRYNFS